MDYKLLGNTGLQVSSLCFGTMSFGKEADAFLFGYRTKKFAGATNHIGDIHVFPGR